MIVENIYFVDKNDSATGETAEKYIAHNSDTKLHADSHAMSLMTKDRF